MVLRCIQTDYNNVSVKLKKILNKYSFLYKHLILFLHGWFVFFSVWTIKELESMETIFFSPMKSLGPRFNCNGIILSNGSRSIQCALHEDASLASCA